MSDGSGGNDADDANGAVRGGGADRIETLPGRPCPLCERPMTHRHCKYVCPEHGVVYDCSDTFW